MRVNADRQTLILAGETPPGRSVANYGSDSLAGSNALAANRSGSGSRVTVISASLNAVVTETDYGAATDYSPAAQYASTGAVAYDAIDAAKFSNSPSVTTRVYPSYGPSSRGIAFGGASAYARTQESSHRQQPLIDTYA